MLRVRYIGIATLAAALAAGAWAACYSPSLEGDGLFYCRDPQQRCPEGFVCGAERICVRPGQPQPPTPDAGADATAPEGGPPGDGAPPSACRSEAPIQIGLTTGDTAGSFGVGVDYDSGNMVVAFERNKELQIARRGPQSRDWSVSAPGIAGGRHVAVDVAKDEALVAYRGKDDDLFVVHVNAASGSTTSEKRIDPLAGDGIAASFHPGGGVWVVYTVRQTAANNQLRSARVDRGSLDVLAPPTPMLQPEGLKGLLRLTSIGGRPFAAFLATAGPAVTVYVEPFNGDWQSPSAVGEATGVPLTAMGLDIFGEATGGANVVYVAAMDGRPVLRLANAKSDPEVVMIGKEPIFDVGSPSMISAEGATALAFIDLRGKAHFIARPTASTPWSAPIAFEDTGGAGFNALQVELVGSQDQGINAVYRAGGRIMQRRLLCDFK